MDDDSKPVAIGLGAGLGGFAGMVIIVCILWHIFCGSWCDRKKKPSTTAPMVTRDRRKMQLEIPNKTNSNITAITPMNTKSATYPDLQSSPPDDKSTR